MRPRWVRIHDHEEGTPCDTCGEPLSTEGTALETDCGLYCSLRCYREVEVQRWALTDRPA